jgi:hypothetical protein
MKPVPSPVSFQNRREISIVSSFDRTSTSAKPPIVSNHWQPHDAPHIVSFNDVKLEHGDGSYSLYRNFQNYGDNECKIRIELN